MSYIKQLQERGENAHSIACDVLQEINDKLRYLQSDKFSVDTTIQVKEFNDFLIEIRSQLFDIKDKLYLHAKAIEKQEK